MSDFNLEFVDESFQYEERVAVGNIVIGDFFESFFSPLIFWTQKDYLENWLTQIENSSLNENRIFFATSMYDPETTNFIFGWSIYFDDEVAYCQNNVLFLDEINEKIDLSRISSYVPQRTVINEDGQTIFEWVTKISDIEAFRNELYSRLQLGY